jgi:hypothetical protein
MNLVLIVLIVACAVALIADGIIQILKVWTRDCD